MEAKRVTQWLYDLQGQNNRQDMDKIPDNSGPLHTNKSHDKPGTWGKRKGSELQGTTQAGNGVQGLKTYRKSDGTKVLRAIRSRDLQTLVSGVYTTIDNNYFTEGVKVSSTNFLNRVYHVSPSDNLSYEEGGLLTEVQDSAEAGIKAKAVITGQNTLFVGGVNEIGDVEVAYGDRVYYSRFDTPTPTHELYADDGETLSTSTRYFSVNGPYMGSFAYQELTYHFSDSACFLFDISQVSTVSAIRKAFNIGLANPRAITECNGWMIFMDRAGRIWAYGGAGLPVPLSWDVEDDSKGEAPINKISASEIDDVCAGSVGNQFWFSVGDITFYSDSISNTVLKGLITQNLSYVMWEVSSYPVKPIIFENGVDANGKEVLYFGADGVDDVYQMNTGTNDGNTAISSFCKTKFFDFGKPIHTKMGDELLVKYRPQSGSNTYLRVRYATDGNYSYTAWSDPDGTVTTFGDSTTQISVIHQGVNTFRYTWDSVGTDPNFSTGLAVGDWVNIQGSNFNTNNKGRFQVTAVGSEYFEIENASGTSEQYKTIGTGHIGLAVIEHGVIDMNNDYSAYKLDAIARIKFPKGINFRTLSIEVGNDQLNETYEVSGLGFNFNEKVLSTKIQNA